MWSQAVFNGACTYYRYIKYLIVAELSPVRLPLSNNIGLKAANKKTTPNTKDAVKTNVGVYVTVHV